MVLGCGKEIPIECNEPECVIWETPDVAIEQKFRLIGAAGIKVDGSLDQHFDSTAISCRQTLQVDSIIYQACQFRSVYDNRNIWYYVLYPSGYNLSKKNKSLVLFSGHGTARQLIQDENSYQKGVAATFAKEGYLVFVMENRGMGRLEYMGDHLDELDVLYKGEGSSWYGAIMTDALCLLNLIFKRSDVDVSNVGVGGVSTGGALSFFSSILDDRIKVAYSQGYFWDFQSICPHPTIHKCNAVFCGLSASQLALNLYPRNLIVVNGKLDQFYPGSYDEFAKLEFFYDSLNIPSNSFYYSPEETPHEFSIEYARYHFGRSLRQDQQEYSKLPILVEPLNAQENVGIFPKLIWEEIDIAQYYQIEISLDESFDNALFSVDSIANNYIQLKDFKHGQRYYWRVRGGNAGGVSEWSKHQYFETEQM